MRPALICFVSLVLVCCSVEGFLAPHAKFSSLLQARPGRRSMCGKTMRAGRIPQLRMMSDEDLSQAFEREKATRQEVDKIFKDASSDLEKKAKKELDQLKMDADAIMKQREEEWEALGAKAAESLTIKVDSLAEEFLRNAGRNVEDDDDEFVEMERFMGPQVVALIGDDTPLRAQLKQKLTDHASLTLSSCERLLETRGLTIEGSDTLVFCGDGEPLDRYTVERLISRPLKLRRVVCVSSVGVERANLFPFSLTNAFSGALDKKRGVELGIVELSNKKGFAYTNVRIGKQVPANNGMASIRIEAGDQMSEDTSVDAASEAVMQTLMMQPFALNNSLSITSVKGTKPTQVDWDDEFVKLDGPEVFRQSLQGVSVPACREWVQSAWSQRWAQPGSGLTTPVKVLPTKTGVQLIFIPKKASFDLSFKEEKALEKAREKGNVDGSTSSGPANYAEGGIEVCVEDSPFGRVRAKRCNMGPETVVKETSEGLILNSLSKDLNAWASQNRK